ncbi:hypothetical protein, partial [Bradyrhizobium sp. ORS 285]|uniref:hypothetical protein n=1 Tax=Bradyrhizobium sp. ORS 285 TaxID=115808 RepID=UPI001AEC0FCB
SLRESSNLDMNDIDLATLRASELWQILRPLQIEGAGKARCRLAPAARLRKKMQAAGTTGSAASTRPSLRDGLNGYGALSSVSGCLATVARAMRQHRRELDASFGAPGPRAFTSAPVSFVGMISHAATRCGHRIISPTLVTTAKRPSCGPRRAECAADLPDDTTPVGLRQNGTTGSAPANTAQLVQRIHAPRAAHLKTGIRPSRVRERVLKSIRSRRS